ncbi:unnamed protein product [Allacma fusca]|uniref:Uncharacterized protein n=1 Tax=Allacma fusca TaxID=39272 RepID=A0A8J2PI92_9HEXA|nr:unnamed protein product [Allacma fusca]
MHTNNQVLRYAYPKDLLGKYGSEIPTNQRQMFQIITPSMDIDMKVIDDASKLKVPYSNIMKFSSRSRRNDKIVHPASQLNFPVNYALEEGAVTKFYRPLFYIGPPFQQHFFIERNGL